MLTQSESLEKLSSHSCLVRLAFPLCYITLCRGTWYVWQPQHSSSSFTDEQKSAAQQLDPSLKALLKGVNLKEELIMAFRVQEIIDRGLFVALDTTEAGLRKTAEEAFAVDPAKGFVHKRELAKIVKA